MQLSFVQYYYYRQNLQEKVILFLKNFKSINIAEIATLHNDILFEALFLLLFRDCGFVFLNWALLTIHFYDLTMALSFVSFYKGDKPLTDTFKRLFYAFQFWISLALSLPNVPKIHLLQRKGKEKMRRSIPHQNKFFCCVLFFNDILLFFLSLQLIDLKWDSWQVTRHNWKGSESYCNSSHCGDRDWDVGILGKIEVSILLIMYINH